MALFVVIAGVLLIIGGAGFLALGFDIVMTERGSAMTIGGVIALSSGVIAVGIGFALTRLSQILRVLDTRGRGGSGVGKGDRPVVPLVTSQPERSDDASPAESATAERTASAAAVAGGVAVAGGAALVAAHGVPPSILAAAATAADELPPKSSAVPTVSVPPDLEAELARALSDSPAVPAPVRSFGEGLSELLAKPARRKHGRPLDGSGEAGGAIAPPLPVQDASASGQVPDLSSVAAAAEHGIDEVAALAAPSDLPELAEAREAEASIGPGESDSSDAVLEPKASDAFDEPAANPPGGLFEDSAFDDLRVGTHAPPEDAAVVETYNIGGRTYSMFSDGSVEAITEKGVQRFRSMEDLRQHLART